MCDGQILWSVYTLAHHPSPITHHPSRLILRGESVLPRVHPIQRPFANAPSNQTQGRKADGGGHAAHLSITAFIDRQLEPARRNFLTKAYRRRAQPKPSGFADYFGLRAESRAVV